MNDFQVTDYIGGSANLVTLSGEKEWIGRSAKDCGDKKFNIVDITNDKLHMDILASEFEGDYIRNKNL